MKLKKQTKPAVKIGNNTPQMQMLKSGTSSMKMLGKSLGVKKKKK